jgi:hypothetical protein
MHGILLPTFDFIDHTRHHAKSNGIKLHEKNAIGMRQTGCAYALEAPTCKVLDAERIPSKPQIAIKEPDRFRGLRYAIAYHRMHFGGFAQFQRHKQNVHFYEAKCIG